MLAGAMPEPADVATAAPALPIRFRPLDYTAPVLLLGRALAEPLDILPVTPIAMVIWVLLAVLWAIVVGIPVAFARRGAIPPWLGHAQVLAVIAILLATPVTGSPLDPLAWAVSLLLLVLVYGLSRWRPHFGATELLYRWSPVLLIAFLYANLRWTFPPQPIWPADIALDAIDRAVFGTPLAQRLEAVESPLLTEWFSFHYSIYLGYIVFTALAFDFFGPPRAFRAYVGRFTVAMFFAFAGYVLVPAFGPWVAFSSEFLHPWPPGIALGPATESMVRTWAYGLDTFPSMHMANSFLAMVSLRPHFPRAFRFVAFAQANLVAATLYLHMHYVVDLAAGLVVAVIAMHLGDRLAAQD